jgi:hypothetical protein
VDRERLRVAAIGYALVGALAVGVPAFFAPHAFYDHFPFVTAWVDKLPPYNEHLVRDVGELYLGFAVLFAWAIRRASLTVPVCTAFIVSQALHTAFHLFHLNGFGAVDAIAEIASLATLVIVPAVAIAAARRA